MALADGEVAPGCFTHSFSNGLRLFGYRTGAAVPEMSGVALGVQVAAGVRHEPDGQDGIGFLLAQMLLQGTEYYSSSEFAAALAGIHMKVDPVFRNNFELTTDFVRYSSVLTLRQGRALDPFGRIEGQPWPGDPLERAIELLAELVQRPQLPAGALEQARERQLQAIEHQYGMPRPDYLARAHLFAGTHLARRAMGRAETVAQLTLDELWAFWRARYRPAGVLVSVVGDFDWSATLEWVGQRFGDWAGEPLDEVDEPPHGRTALVVEQRAGKAQAIGLAAPFPPSGDPDYYAAALASSILGGYSGVADMPAAVDMSCRLITEVAYKRELVGPIMATYEPNAVLGSLLVYATTEVERAPRAVRAILDELWRLAESGVTEQELEHARTRLLTGLSLGPYQVPGHHVALRQFPLLARTWWYADRPVTPQQIAAAIQAVSPEQIAGLLRRFPLVEPVVIAGIGPLSAEALMGVPTLVSVPAFLEREHAAARAAQPAETLPDGTVYLSTSDEVLALEGGTGTARWRWRGSLRGVARGGDALYGIDADGALVALRAQDGSTSWRSHARASAFLVGEALICGVTPEGAAFAADATDGALRWTTDPRGYVHVHAARDGTLYVRAERRAPAGATLAALRLADGTMRWEYAWPYTQSVEWHDEERLPFALGDGLVYFSPFDDFLLALDAEHGEPVWRCALSTNIETAPVVRGDIVYVASNGRLFAVGARDGAVLWRQRLSTEGIYSYSMYSSELLLHMSNLVADEERAYVTEFYIEQYSDNASPVIASVFRAVSLADGTPVWERARAVRFVLGSNQTVIRTAADWGVTDNATSVIAARDGTFLWDRGADAARDVGAGRSTVYVVAGPDLQALRAEDGAVRWSYPLGAGLAPSADKTSAVVSLVAE